jgi:copper chaperone
MAELENKLSFEVRGMTCSHCQAAVEEAIRQTPGVVDARVDLAAGQAVVTGSFDPQRIIDAIEQAGYETNPKQH